MRYTIIVILALLIAACAPAQQPKAFDQIIRYAPNTPLTEAKADCATKGGKFNECGSACDPGEICIEVCVPVCEPKGYQPKTPQKTEPVKEAPAEPKEAPKVEGTLTTKPATHDVQVKDFKFTPTVLEINKGDTVRWTNLDGPNHTATGDNFDTGLLAQGQSGEFTFTEAGSFDYHCTLHPSMRAQVVVS